MDCKKPSLNDSIKSRETYTTRGGIEVTILYLNNKGKKSISCIRGDDQTERFEKYDIECRQMSRYSSRWYDMSLIDIWNKIRGK